MKFYVSGVEKSVYRVAIEAEDADDAVAKFKEMVESESIEEADTYLDEVSCRTEGQDFPEIYDGADSDEDEDDDDEEYEEEGEDEADLEQTPSEPQVQTSEPSQPSQGFNQQNNPY